MRTLTSTLTAQQKSGGLALCKAVINSVTYSLSSTNRLLRVKHNEQPMSQTAQIVIDDVDLTLSGLSLEGTAATISYGYNTSAGDEYSATAPLKVKSQEVVTTGGVQQCLLECIGLGDQMAEDHASSDLTPQSDDTRTVKTLISAIMGATLAPFSHCPAITVTYDSEDSLIDTFLPKDYFRIFTGDTRKAKVQELLGYTKCVGRFEDDGEFHILNPTVSGSTYAYEYADAFLAANHTFLSRVYRTRLVLPNKITVKSPSAHSPAYTGNATSSASYALLPKEDFILARLASNAQATSIAEAKIQRLEVEHEKGNGLVPMNCGQEVYDYVNITSEAAGNSRAGNIGYLTRIWDSTKRDNAFTMGFGFGDILLGGSIPFGDVSPDRQYATYNDLQNLYAVLQGNLTSLRDWVLERDTVPVWKVTQSLQVPSAGV